MQVDPTIFKAYDIRGVYPTQLNENLAEKIARAFIAIVKPKSVVIGRDGRISSPKLHKSIVKALINNGVNVIDIGMCSSDMYYYACAEKEVSGIMVTASHNPKQYNGFKMVKKIPYFLTGDDGIAKIKKMIISDKLPTFNNKQGKLSKWNTMEDYSRKILSLINTKKLKPLNVLVDPANGMVGPIFQNIEKRLKPINVIPLYFKPDGNFPNHGGDPQDPKNRVEMERLVPKKADIGVMFDPDGDRFFVIDKKGRYIPGDFMTAILAKQFLKKKPNSKIVYDIRASKIVPDWIKQAGGTPLYNRVGHSYIKKRMINEKAIFGGEVSGHYYFSDFYYVDSGTLAFLYLIEFLSQTNKSLEQIVDDMESSYFISGEINSEVKNVKKVLEKIESVYKSKAKKILKIDGISVEMQNYRFNVRGSNTEPKIRLNLEAESPKIMKQKRNEVLKFIRSNAFK